MAANSIPVHFPEAQSSSGVAEAGPSHVLLELPPELLKLVEEGSEEEPLSLTIKGRPSDDAVVCTKSKTYTLRTVQISNELTLLNHRPPEREISGGSISGRFELFDTLHELVELGACMPRLAGIRGALRGQRWSGSYDKINESDNEDDESRYRKRTKYTVPHLQSLIQASDEELLAGLADQNVITLPSTGQLLHLPARRLPSLLTPLLNLLALHSNLTPPHSVHANLVLDGLNSEDILGTPPAGCDVDELAEAVLAHFGSFFGEKGEPGRRWKVDAARCIREVGRGLLEGLEEGRPTSLQGFTESWQEAAGEAFAEFVKLEDLAGNYILQTPTALLPLPLPGLPADPAARLARLFALRAKWRATDLRPFLRDLAVDAKGVDRLVGKHGRVVKEREGADGGVVEWVYKR